MNKKNRKIIGAVILSAILSLGVIASVNHKNNNEISETVAETTYSQSVNDYYSNISWDLTGANLKTALYNKIKISTAGWSYDGLWEAYKKTDVRPDGTHFWDIYSDTTMYTLNDKRINASYKKEGDSINREHVIPQSSFNEAAPMKSDVHHVLPSDGYVNNRRSAYPHGIVTGSPTYTSNDGCKLGSGTGSTTVFEPMDNYKGDIARIYFYFVTCYQNKMSNNSFSAFDKSEYPSIKTAYLNVYLQWAKEDPVSEKEIIRNNEAYKGQGNRNPFIDCPYAVGAIWDPTHASDYGVKGQYTSGAGISISKTSASLISGNTTTISATSTNSSQITWTTSNSSVVSLSSSSSASGSNITLTAGSAGTATITAKATIDNQLYSKTCTVSVAATKQVTSITLSDQKTKYQVDDTFVKPTVTASYNDDTEATVTNDATFTGYDMSTAGNYTVTASYTFGGVTKTATYEIVVSTSGGSEDIDDYDISTTPLTSSNIKNGMKVAFGSSPTNLAKSIDSNWIYLSSTKADWLVFTLEGSSSGFTLKNGENYIYCSGAKKVAFDESHSTSFTLRADNLVTNSTSGTFYYNSTGLRPYTSGSYESAYLYELTQEKTFDYFEISSSPSKSSYLVGETFDPTGLVIERTYTDKSTDTYTYLSHESDFTFVPSLITPLTIDDDTIEIIYNGDSVFYPIDIDTPKTLDSIEISGMTTHFVEGDEFSFGGTVTVYYTDGSDEDVTSMATFSGYDMTITGNQTVTVTYNEESTSYIINVAMGTLSSIEVTGMTTSYVKNGSFSFDGTCVATFANGYEKEVTPTSVTSPDMSTTGNKTITVTYTYNNKTVSTSYVISVNAYRTVMEETESILGTINYSSGSEVISNETLTTSKSGYTTIENGPDTSHKALRLGSGSSKGTLTITSTSANIYKVIVNARNYNNDSSVDITIGGSKNTLTSSYREYSKEYTSSVNSVAIATTTNGKRAWIASISVYTKTEQDIGQSEDCVGLETFINNYMHMDYTENLGYCNDAEHHYYSSAKAAFNELNEHQRKLFTSNEAYSTEYERLSTWAEFNNESLSSNNLLVTNSVSVLSNDNMSSNMMMIIILVSTCLIATLSISSVIIIKKKRIH